MMATSSHPLSFHLLTPDGNSVLGIFDGQGQTSKLEIKNTSHREWQLMKPTSEVPSVENHHFELKFRPGTLNPNAKVTVDTGWKVSEQTPSKTNDGVSLYLLRTDAVSVKQNSGTFVTLRNLSADPRGGARGTRVELKWTEKLGYAGSSEKVPAGQRVQHLSIINER